MSVYRYISTEELDIRNPLFTINSEVDNTFTDVNDMGFIGKYYDGANVSYTGLFRDATDATFKLFDGLQTAPNTDTGVVDILGTGYSLANLHTKDIHAFGSLTVEGDMTISGTVTSFDVNTLTVEDNIIVANAGPANVKEDAGFVVRRPKSAVILDTPKESGTASASGTTTTVTLQVANGHGTLLNYYAGWIIKFAGDVTGSAIVVSSTAANPPVLTVDTAATGSTSTSTTYQLFNKQYVGTIYDESTDKLTSYGFPRENEMGVIDIAGNAGDGNKADFIDTQARDAHLSRDLYLGGVIKGGLRVDDNFAVVNTGPDSAKEDSGYVLQRTAARVATDAPKIAAVVINTNYIATATTLIIDSAETGNNFFKGWVITDSVNSEARTIVSSTDNTGDHTLILDSGFTSALTAGTNTVNLFNRRYVGTVYDESTNTYMAVGFPREEGEDVIDPLSPVNGNVPDYINMAVNNLTVAGSLSMTGGFVLNTKTQVTATTFTADDILQNDIIYLNPSADTTYTLPSLASIALGADLSRIVMFVNIGSFKATVARNSTDTIEGLTTLALRRVYSKTVLIASSEHPSFWTIKG